MATLLDLINNEKTDKNTLHSYIDLYEKLLSPKKGTALNVLEIGIYKGGSVKLWHDYFTKANVYGLDIMNINDAWSEIQNNNRIILYTSTDAYSENFVDTVFVKSNIRFDMMLDDGPHTLDSMKNYIKLYSRLLKDDGIMICEDIQDWNWIDILKECVPDNLKQYIETYDLRKNKGRYDDIVFVINKNK